MITSILWMKKKIEEKLEEMNKVRIECIWVEHVKVVNGYIYFVNEEKLEVNVQSENRMYLSWTCKSGQWLHLFCEWRKKLKKN